MWCRRTVLVEGALCGLAALDGANVFEDVVFGVDVGSCRTYAGNCPCNGCCDGSDRHRRCCLVTDEVVVESRAQRDW